jgi:hypothetical protein
VAEDPDKRARVHACWSTAGAGKAELTGGPTAQRERERERACGGNNLVSSEAGPRGREGEEHAGEGNRCRQPGPTEQKEGEGELVGEGTTADRWRPPVKRRGREGVRPGWAELGRLGYFGFFFFPGFSICFSISFSLGFPIQIQIKFQIQTNSNMCNNSKNI